MIKINMPVIGQDIPTGVVLEWLKTEGDPVEKDEVIAAVQSEKADFDVEAPASGILLKILKEAGEEAEVLTPIGYIGEPGEVYEEPAEKDDEPADEQKGRSATPVHTGPEVSGEPSNKGKVVASPLARRVARESGISLEMIRGTGPNGRIIKKNVLASLDTNKSAQKKYDSTEEALKTGKQASKALSAEEGDWRESYGRVRRVIADRMTMSVRNIPHFYLNADVVMDQAVTWRSSANQSHNAQFTYTDIIVHAVATLLREFPRLNAYGGNTELVYKKRVNIGVAVASKDGLLVPVIPDSDQKDILTISGEIKEKSRLAREGRLDLSTRGTFTISSLGMYGISSFQPIINPPETGILAVGKIEDRIVAMDRTIGFRKMMTVTLACDHRAVDGAYGAEFLKRFCEIMEKADFLVAKW